MENDPNIGAILHVLTFSSGSTEYGTSASCTGNNNGGATLPTCATSPVIPGSTSGSTATDFMLPLGLVAANAATGAAGAADSFSSPFTDYANDTTYVGDNNGYLYAITPTFKGTPAHAGGNFPVHVNATAPVSDTPTAGDGDHIGSDSHCDQLACHRRVGDRRGRNRQHRHPLQRG